MRRLMSLSYQPLLAFCLALTCFLPCVHELNAQTTIGVQPNGSYTASGLDQVSLSDLGVHIDLPLFNHQGRGADMGVRVHLVYDSSYTGTSPYPDWGWRIISGTGPRGNILVHKDSTSEFVQGQCKPGVNQCHVGYNSLVEDYAFVDATGYQHWIGQSTAKQCVGVSSPPCTSVPLHSGQTLTTDGDLFTPVVLFRSPTLMATRACQPFRVIPSTPQAITH
jgi:hypothetical protein